MSYIKKRYYLLLTSTILFPSLLPAQESIKTDALIKQATVYKQGAALVHKAPVSIPKGNHEIVIKNVANSLDENSIQVQAPAQMTIMSVSFAKTYKDPKIKEIKLPNSELQVANRKLNQIQNRLTAEERTLLMLETNQNISGANIGLSVAELSKMTQFYKQQQTSLRDTIALLNEQKILQQQLINELTQEAGLNKATPLEAGGYIILQVQTNSPVQADLQVSYYTPNASWTPTYDFRVNNTQQPIQIAYKGNIVQNTGITWKNTKLELSTYNPSQSNFAPEPYTWFLKYGHAAQSVEKTKYLERNRGDYAGALESNVSGGSPGSSNAVRIRGFSSVSANSSPLYVVDGAVYTGDISNINPNDILNYNVLSDATAVSLYGSRGSGGAVVITTNGKGMSNHTTLTEQELNTSFEIALPYDIASNGKQHSVILKEFTHPAFYNHFALPKIEKDAFLITNLTNFENLQLMPGEANIIFENTYVGKTYINPLIVQDTLKMSVGRDKNVHIQRLPIKDKSSTKIFSGKKTQVFTYEIKVKNSKSEVVNVTINEMYPIASDANMEVELLESSKANVNKEKALLTWDVKLQPAETKTFRISYSVKYPSNQVIGNL